ncbi:hypothetical protein Tco_1466619 [Tanacetum coccineum]
MGLFVLTYWIWFSPLLILFFGELEKDAVTLLKQIQRFSVTQDIGEHAVVHIFNRIGFAILEEWGPRYFAGVAKLSYALRTCSHVDLLEAQVQFDHALRASLEKIVTASGPGFFYWQWRLATLPIKLGGLGSSFKHALDAFNTTCNVDVLSVTTCTSAPQMMKNLAKCYFGVIEKDLVSKLSVPMFSEGVKFRYNMVRDILVDICSKVGIMVRKEAPMGFLLEDGKDLRPADLLLFNWLKGKDACLDVTCISPFAGMGASSWAPGVALHNAVEKKKRKYASICEKNGYKFIPFAFSMFGEFDTEALGTLSRNKSISISHSNNAKSGTFIFHRVSFCIQKGVGAQLVSRLPSNFIRAQVAPKSFWRIFMETMMYRVLVYIIVIKHRHNVGHDTLVDICFRSGISAGKEVDIRLSDGRSSPLMQIGMTDFMPGRVVIDASQRKRVKEGCDSPTEADSKFFVAQDIGARVVVHIFSDVLNYAFLASRLQYASLQTKLLRHSGVVASGPTFNDALCAFNTKMETGLLSNTSVPLFSVSKPCSACSKVFTGDIYGNHNVSYAGIIGIKHRHNVVRDTLVDICFRLGISVGKEVDIGLGSSPLTQTGMADFVSGRVVIDATHRKRVKYEAKCANIGYGFLPFSFSSLDELEKDEVTQDIRARATVHIFKAKTHISTPNLTKWII